MKRPRVLAVLIFSALAVLLFRPLVEAGDTLTRIKGRAKVRCGVSDGI
ncbi:MAG TPA: ABC transporter substrate-binding protein, partial [Syntrophobacteraceae bacterium]|nr:ABC transporter substrate-binding protein [Syntrophobacteraceae bacterium]